MVRARELSTPAVRVLLVLAFVLAAVYWVVASIHWQMMMDTPVMHYVVFLMRHGFKPYINISDNNMPGAYYTEAWGMWVFGGSDLAWRVYDFCLLAVLIGALIQIAKPYDWLAGLIAGGLFLILHAAEGPSAAVEREQVITVLLALGFCAMFAGVRRQVPALMGVFGIACGIAASIKPTFLPLAIAVVIFMAITLRRKKIGSWRYIAWAVAGLAAVAALDLGFLLHYHAVRAFEFVIGTITPAYATYERFGVFHLLGLTLPAGIGWFLLLVAAAAVTLQKRRNTWTWEQWVLAMGVAFGVLSFVVQGKGFGHHRYTYLVFLYLLCSIELLAALRHAGWPGAFALAAVVFLLLGYIPYFTREIHRRRPGQAVMANVMESDLNSLGGTKGLQDKVQCLDLVDGCLNALYHLQLVENTGFTGDLLFFTTQDTVATRYYRAMYWDLERKDPPTVLILSNMVLRAPDDFDKVKNWKEFDVYLQQNFTEVTERDFLPSADAYRIYIRNDSPILRRAVALKAEGKF